MNIIDKLIELVSPEKAFKRAMYRQGLSTLRNYDAARTDRLGSNWLPTSGTAEQVDRNHRDIIRARARDLERNSDLAEGIVGAIVRNVVGTGIKPQARVRTKRGKLDENTNNLLETEWKRWVKAQNCDITGQNTFYELQAMALRRRIYDGEIFVRKVIDTSARVPLKLQLIEPDMLDVSKVSEGKNLVLSGVEIDEYYRPVAYHFYSGTPDGYMSLKSIRVPAKQVIHLFNKMRPTQVRGISELARVMQRIKDTGEYLDAEIMKARIAACFAVFIETPNSGIRMRNMPQVDGKRIDTIEPGMIENLLPGEKISVVNPTQSASTAKDFIEVETRLAGAGTGLSYEVISRDVSKVNFSSARQNLLEDRKTFMPLQDYLINHFCQPIWEEFVKHCVLAGIIKASDFDDDPERYFECLWVRPGWQWIDPLKEVQASKEELKAGITTLARICGSQGLDWQEVLQQRAVEREYAKQLGLELDIDVIEGTEKQTTREGMNEGETEE